MHPGEVFLSCRRVSGLRWGEPLSLSWAPSKFRSSFKLRRPLGIVRRRGWECNKPGFESAL